MPAASRLLLLDLDGVVVTERAPAAGGASQILLLHEELARKVRDLGMPVAVLTHRSRREARCILEAARIPVDGLAALFAAEDLFLAGLSRGAFGRLAVGGLRKSLVVPVIRKRFGVEAGNMIFVDDRIDNVKDLAQHGLGLGIHAPSSEDAPGGSVESFDFDEVVQAVADWTPGSRSCITLKPVAFDMQPWRLTGIATVQHEGHLFNRARRMGSAIRQWLF